MSTPAAPFPIDVSGAPAARGTWWRGGWPPLLLALGCAAAYAVFLVLPFHVNALDAYPRDELASGAHPPRDLWPYTLGAGWGPFRVAGMTTFLLGPAGAVATLAWAVVRTRHGTAAGDLRRTAPAVVAAALAAGTVVWLFSPSGITLMTWFLA